MTGRNGLMSHNYLDKAYPLPKEVILNEVHTE